MRDLMRRMSGGRAAVAGALASAILFALYARGGAAWPLGFVALVPWLLSLDRLCTWRGTLASAWLACVGFVAAVFAWFGVAIGDFTGIGTAPGVLVLLLGAPLLQPQFFAFAFARRLCARRGAWLRALAGACAWVACEWLLPKLLGDTLGHGLVPSRLLRQAADIGGAAGLSVALLLANQWLAMAIARRRDAARAWAVPLAAWVAMPLVLAGYGAWRLQALEALPATATLRVGLVQSNIVDYERLRRERGAYAVVREVLDAHYALSDAALRQHADALLWSETVYPTTFAHPRSADAAALDAEILGFAAARGVPLVFGSYDLDGAGEYNAAAFVDPHAGLLGFQRKTHPFPLTERVPPWLDGPRLRRWLPWTGAWQAGDGPRVFPLRLANGREIPAAALICLDDVQPRMGIDAARLGAQVLLGMSNDSWFTRFPQGMRLHRDVAAFRSIETRLPQLRVTANGMTAAIDAGGGVVAQLAPRHRGVLVAAVQPRAAAPTLMVRWGDWVGPSAMALLALLALVAAAHRWQGTHALGPSASAQIASDRAWPGDAAIPPPWRWLAHALRMLAGVALVGMAWALLGGVEALGNPLSRLRLFAALVLAPLLAAWAMGRAFGAASRVRSRFDHPLLKYGVFALVPALPAFRLHQHIAYGGTFGEWQTFGAQAWFGALLLWWASWIASLAMVGAVLRALLEAIAWFVARVRPAQRMQDRRMLESLGRLAFYLGVPAWLAIRLWPW